MLCTYINLACTHDTCIYLNALSKHPCDNFSFFLEKLMNSFNEY